MTSKISVEKSGKKGFYIITKETGKVGGKYHDLQSIGFSGPEIVKLKKLLEEIK